VTAPVEPPPPATSPSDTTGTDTTGTAPSDTTALPPDRSSVRLAVLNGTSVTGLAGRTATAAERLGYVNVPSSNAPAQTGGSIVYYRPGSRDAAVQAAQDLDIAGSVTPLPASGALAEAAPPDADVIVVLGPGTG
jgi:hypothetical protein